MRLIKYLILIQLLFSSLLHAQTKVDSLESLIARKNDIEKVDLLNELSLTYRDIQPESGIDYGNRALDLANELNYRIGIAEALKNIGANLRENEAYDKAIEYYLKSLEIKEELGDNKGVASIYNSIGIIYRNLKEYDKALENYSKSLEIRESIGDKQGIARLYNNIGIIYKNLRDHEKALEYYSNSLEIKESMGDKQGIARLYNNIAILHSDLENPDKAIEFYLKSLDIKEELEDKKGVASIYNSIGVIYRNLIEYDKAIEYYSKSLEIRENIGDKQGISSVLNNLGVLYRILNNYDKALEYYLKSLEIKEEIGKKNDIANTLNNLGVLYINLNDYEKALEFYLKSLEIKENIGDKEGIVSTLNNLGLLYLKLNDYNKAQLYFEKGFEIAKEINVKSKIRNSYENFSTLYTLKNDNNKAFEYYKLYTALKDSIAVEESRKNIAEIEAKYEIRDKEKEIEILKSENTLRDFELKSQREIKNSFLVVIGLLLILVSVIYSRYRLKNKANRELRNKSYELENERNMFIRGDVVVFKWKNEKKWPIEYVSANVKDVLGFTNEELINEKTYYADIIPKEDFIRLNDEINTAIERAVTDFTHDDYRIIRKDGEIIWIYAHTTILRNDNNEVVYFFGYILDVSERKKVEKEKKKLEGKLIQSQKLEAIGRLAGGIAHDFNNILATVMGYADFLSEKFKDSTTPEGNAVKVIIDESQRAANLTNQLLGFARGGKYNPININLNNVIENSINDLEKMFGKEIKVMFDFGKKLNLIEADENQIEQIFTNLFINAKDAMKDGGELMIKTENVKLEDSFAKRYPNIIPGDHVKVSIRDTGTGIPPNILDQIFEPFFTTKEIGKGSGLGLSMVFGIINNHSGSIDVESEPGKGTTFNLYFPKTKKVKVNKRKTK